MLNFYKLQASELLSDREHVGDVNLGAFGHLFVDRYAVGCFLADPVVRRRAPPVKGFVTHEHLSADPMRRRSDLRLRCRKVGVTQRGTYRPRAMPPNGGRARREGRVFVHYARYS